jgi:hypothetical protein
MIDLCFDSLSGELTFVVGCDADAPQRSGILSTYADGG